MRTFMEEYRRWLDSPALSENEWAELNAIAEDEKEKNVIVNEDEKENLSGVYSGGCGKRDLPDVG